MAKFNVSVEAEFVAESGTSSAIMNKLRRMFRDNDFEEKNFEVSVKKMAKVKEALPSVLEHTGGGVVTSPPKPKTRRKTKKVKRGRKKKA